MFIQENFDVIGRHALEPSGFHVRRGFNQHLYLGMQMSFEKSQSLSVSQRPYFPAPFLDDVWGHPVREFVCRGPFSGGEREYMQVGEREALDEGEGVLVCLVGFTGKSNHHIRTDGSFRQRPVYCFDSITKVFLPIRPVHPF